ncbi:hypothetical protein [Bradyrhizobium lablabi]|uniref:hypothetical protein n=1 Tax=Bradyrhizobium lablabi TaxID=722472 RepID=UPI001BA4F3EC|nr:hypothetical protein [Bradyrhizobium lablabi]MBR0693655.1 hypothetical protein [Bradyrhizobium lablabi]
MDSIFDRHPAFPQAVRIPHDSPIGLYAERAAGCGGVVFLNLQTGELLLCDGSDLILWSGPLLPNPSL